MKQIISVLFLFLLLCQVSAGETEIIFNHSQEMQKDSIYPILTSSSGVGFLTDTTIPPSSELQEPLLISSATDTDKSTHSLDSVIHVGPDKEYHTISDGITHASDGDIILIDSGTYPEGVTIDKLVHLLAADPSFPPVIDGQGTDDPVTIQKSGVILQDLAIVNGNRSSTRYQSHYGITLNENVNNIHLMGVTISDCQGGIGSSDSTTSNLLISDSVIVDIDETGIDFLNISDSVITGSEIRNCSPAMLADELSDSIITNNIIANNHKEGGLSLLFVSGSDISYNQFDANEVYADDIDDSMKAALYIDSLTNSSVCYNSIIDTKGFGLSLKNNSGTLQNNFLSGNTHGIWLSVMGADIPETSITNNTVDTKPILYYANRNGLLLDGTQFKVQPASILIDKSKDITISDISFHSSDGFGLFVTDSQNVTIHDCEISGYVDQGILLAETEEGDVYTNQISDNGHIGIGLLNVSHIKINNNYAIDNINAIAAIADLTSSDITSNTISGGFIGINLDEVATNPEEPYRIEFNTINDAQIGIVAQVSKYGIIEGNQITNTSESRSCGISVMGSSHMKISDNTITGTKDGLQVDAYGGAGKAQPAMENIIERNKFESLNKPLLIDPASEYVYNNTFMLNDFITTQNLGSEVYGMSSDSNNWFSTPEQVVYRYHDETFYGYLGNYWSEYLGTDTNGNGVGEENYQVAGNNTDSYPLINETSFYIPVDRPDYFLVLESGWNYVAVPKTLCEGKNTGEIFSDLNTGGRSIVTYNPISEQWDVITKNTPIEPLFGYWIYVTESSSLGLYFRDDPIYPPPKKDVYKGWNAIGFSGLVATSARDTLLSVQDIWATAIGFNANLQRYNISIINGGDGIHSDTQLLYPGTAYWIWMNQNGTLSSIFESSYP